MGDDCLAPTSADSDPFWGVRGSQDQVRGQMPGCMTTACHNVASGLHTDTASRDATCSEDVVTWADGLRDPECMIYKKQKQWDISCTPDLTKHQKGDVIPTYHIPTCQEKI